MKYDVIILEQYGKLAGGQTVAMQLFDLLSPKLNCQIFAPSGPWSDSRSDSSVSLIGLSFSSIVKDLRRLWKSSHRDSTIIINGPRTAALALMLRVVRPRIKLVYYLHNKPTFLWMRIAGYLVSMLSSSRVSVAHCISDLIWRPQVLHNCARPEVRLDLEQIRTSLDGRSSSDVTVIKFIGRADPVKGLDVLLEALVQLSRTPDLPAWKAQIAIGAGLHTALPSELLVDSPLVEFVGPKNALWLQPGDILCVPSRFEASPLIVQEGMIRGASLVTSDSWGLGEEVDATVGFRFVTGSSSSLASQLASALSSSAERDKRLNKAYLQALTNIASWEGYWLNFVPLSSGVNRASLG